MAVLSLALAFGHRPVGPTRMIGLLSRLRLRQARRLADARISGNANSYVAMMLVAPAVLFGAGWLQSPVLAFLGGAAGLAAPRLYLAWVVHAQSQRSESEAPRLVQALLSGLTSGSTYLDALRQARNVIADPWIREDLDFVIQRFMLDVPLHASVREVRARIHTTNLGLIWETLDACTNHQLPTQAARTLFFEVAATIQFNIQLAGELRARSSGQRAQIWLLAIIVPGMYLYLRLISPQLLSVLDETALGRYLLVPVAAALEVLGIVLSFRIAKVDT